MPNGPCEDWQNNMPLGGGLSFLGAVGPWWARIFRLFIVEMCLCRHCVGPWWAMIESYPRGEVYALVGNILALGGHGVSPSSKFNGGLGNLGFFLWL